MFQAQVLDFIYCSMFNHWFFNHISAKPNPNFSYNQLFAFSPFIICLIFFKTYFVSSSRPRCHILFPRQSVLCIFLLLSPSLQGLLFLQRLLLSLILWVLPRLISKFFSHHPATLTSENSLSSLSSSYILILILFISDLTTSLYFLQQRTPVKADFGRSCKCLD